MVLIIGSKNETPELVELVSNRFKTIKKTSKTDEIEALQSWLQKQPHLPKLSDNQILVFLHASNYSVEKAKETLDNYYTLRTRAPEIFTDRTPKSAFTRAFTIAYFVYLPESAKSYKGNQLAILRIRDPDPFKADFVEGVKTTFALLDLAVGKYPFCEGIELIMDMQGLVLGHLSRVDFSALRVFMAFCQDALPFRLKAVHVVNTFPLINQIMTLIKPLLKVEFLKKLSFYSPNDFKTLTSQHIPLESLPSNYGGTLDSIDKYQDDTYAELVTATPWLEELEAYKVNESKRLGRRRSDLNVCDGSFKKLEID